jgi:hypothetical protein
VMQRPVIVIPGLMGTALINHYPPDPSLIWSLTSAFQKAVWGVEFDALALTPEGADYSDEVISRPHRALSVPYEDLAQALRRRLGPAVYVFRYDWRRSAADSGLELKAFVQEIQRKPLTSIEKGWDGEFDFVCHSFGGIVFRSFLDHVGADDSVHKVVFMGTPHQGSLDAVDGLIRGDGGFLGGHKEMRRLVRTFPSVYELLPRYPNAVVTEHDQPVNIFDVSNWQSNIVTTQAKPKKFGLGQTYLDNAKSVVENLADPVELLGAENILSVIGLDPGSTEQTVTVRKEGEENRWYDFDNLKRGIGDGTVLLTSAHLRGTQYVWLDSKLLPILGLMRLMGLHAALPAMDEAHTVTARFLRGLSGQALLPRNLHPSRLVEDP